MAISIDVKVTEIDNRGRCINVSAKALLPKPKTEEEKQEEKAEVKSEEKQKNNNIEKRF